MLLAILCLLSALANAQVTIPPTEGFSLGKLGIPLTAIEVWDSTVRIENTSRNCREEQWIDKRKWGTGVVIDYDHTTRIATVATNSHVITSCKSGLNSILIGFLKTDDDRSHEETGSIEILLNNESLDLALFRVKVPKKVNAAVAKISLPEANQKVLAIGYPDLSARKDWVNRPKSREVRRRFSYGTIRSVVTTHVFHSADILPGNSGGPLVNEQGELVGLNTKMIRRLSPKDKERQGSSNYFYCANELPGATDCQNFAVSSKAILQETAKLGR